MPFASSGPMIQRSTTAEVRTLDSPEWEHLIERTQNPSFLQDESWGKVKGCFGWKATRIGVIGQEGNPVTGLQLLTRTIRPLKCLPGIGIAYIPRGPIGTVATTTFPALLSKAVVVASKSGASFLRIEPPIESFGTVKPVLKEFGFTRHKEFIQIRATGYVDLTPLPNDILARFKSKTRYNIRLSERHGVKLRIATEMSDLDSFYKMTVVTGERDGFAVHGQEYYNRIWHTCQPDRGHLLIASVEEQDVAALFTVRCGSVATYLYGASTGAHRRAMPNYCLQWNAMKWGREMGCTTYDLWGMQDPEISNDPMAGVNRFKEGFRPEPILHPGAYDLKLNQLAYQVLTRVILPVRSTWESVRSGKAPASPPI